MYFDFILNEDKQELQQTCNAIVQDISKLTWVDPKKGGLFGIIDRVVGIYPYNKKGTLYWGILLQLNTTATTLEGKQAGQQLIMKYHQAYPQHIFKLEVNENAVKILVNEIVPQQPQQQPQQKMTNFIPQDEEQ